MNTIQKEVLNRISIKSVKTMNGRDGLAINCNIFLDNKKVASYHNSGNGGCGDTHPFPIKDNFDINRKKLNEVETLISKLPKVDGNLTVDIDWVVEELIGINDFKKNLKKSICYGVDSKSDVFGVSLPNQYHIISFKGIRDLKKLNPTQLKNQIEKVKKNLTKNQIIFNKF